MQKRPTRRDYVYDTVYKKVFNGSVERLIG